MFEVWLQMSDTNIDMENPSDLPALLNSYLVTFLHNTICRAQLSCPFLLSASEFLSNMLFSYHLLYCTFPDNYAFLSLSPSQIKNTQQGWGQILEKGFKSKSKSLKFFQIQIKSKSFLFQKDLNPNPNPF